MEHAWDRLLNNEVVVCDLLAVLAAAEQGPLQALLGTSSEISVRREASTGGGRADLLISDDTGVVAVVEVKLSADEHGDQLAKYQTAHPAARLFYASLEQEVGGLDSRWKPIDLSELFALWTGAGDATTRAMAEQARRFTSMLSQESRGPLGAPGRSTASLPIALRRTAAQLSRTSPGLGTSAGKTSGGGNPLMLAWKESSTRPGLWWVVDVRCRNRYDSDMAWDLRLGLEADRTLLPLRNRLMTDMLDGLRTPAVKKALDTPVATISAADEHQGLKSTPRAPRNLPVEKLCFYDRRGAVIYTRHRLDVSRLDSHGLGELINRSLGYLAALADAAPDFAVGDPAE
ncbi:PD-(D/E)XK nuclease superfamily protein [Pseudokineococcus lusitanus]|uniref:PD-(D/E)XK nuclease superfamily protein n=1 Tax=Pseudokineococcus lusitanus TaxID=763993 RepID=A0A3N1HQU2_9ACTN|nr:PD-(D/E)XK nuclease superfamily protein [Pseudokineococcus lusitanus]